MFNKTVFPLVVFFLITAAFFFLFRTALQANGFNWKVLSGGNLFLYLVTVISMNMLSNGLNAANTQSFLRNAYGGIIIKLFACAAAVVLYIYVSGKSFNKSSLFVCMGLYLVYTYMEFKGILKQSNDNKNGQN